MRVRRGGNQSKVIRMTLVGKVKGESQKGEVTPVGKGTAGGSRPGLFFS